MLIVKDCYDRSISCVLPLQIRGRIDSSPSVLVFDSARVQLLFTRSRARPYRAGHARGHVHAHGRRSGFRKDGETVGGQERKRIQPSSGWVSCRTSRTLHFGGSRYPQPLALSSLRMASLLCPFGTLCSDLERHRALAVWLAELVLRPHSSSRGSAAQDFCGFAFGGGRSGIAACARHFAGTLVRMDLSSSRGRRFLPAFLSRPSGGNARPSSLSAHAANPSAAFQFFDCGLRDWALQGAGGNQVHVAAFFRAPLPSAADCAWRTLDGLHGIAREACSCASPACR